METSPLVNLRPDTSLDSQLNPDVSVSMLVSVLN